VKASYVNRKLTVCHHKETPMIARMIYVKVPPEQIQEAIEDWKQI